MALPLGQGSMECSFPDLGSHQFPAPKLSDTSSYLMDHIPENTKGLHLPSRHHGRIDALGLHLAYSITFFNKNYDFVLWIGFIKKPQMLFNKFFFKHMFQHSSKIVGNTFQFVNVLQSRGQCPKSKKINRGHIYLVSSPRIKTLSLGLERNNTLQYVSDNFPRMLTYLLFLENC